MECDDTTHEETGFPEIRVGGQLFLTMPIRDESCDTCMRLKRGGSFQLPISTQENGNHRGSNLDPRGGESLATRQTGHDEACPSRLRINYPNRIRKIPIERAAPRRYFRSFLKSTLPGLALRQRGCSGTLRFGRTRPFGEALIQECKLFLVAHLVQEFAGPLPPATRESNGIKGFLLGGHG